MALLEALPSADDSGEAEAEASSGEEAPTVVKEGGKALIVLSNESNFCRSVLSTQVKSAERISEARGEGHEQRVAPTYNRPEAAPKSCRKDQKWSNSPAS